jgi:pimeloyl-ACP methyl ester carboxylesterase
MLHRVGICMALSQRPEGECAVISVTLSQLTAPNLRIEAANGVTYAYRRFGISSTGALPLVCLVHSRGNLDSWDPMLVDTLATQRQVILVDNAGVGGSTGTVPSAQCPAPWPRWRGTPSRSSTP